MSALDLYSVAAFWRKRWVYMVCYIVPLSTAIAVVAARKALGKTGEKSRRLAGLLSGGAIFGVVDHAWNGQLAFVGPNWAWDVALGIAITLSVAAFWLALEALSPSKEAVAART
jgi:NO-binding membrane sensor protein with MHYT domain